MYIVRDFFSKEDPRSLKEFIGRFRTMLNTLEQNPEKFVKEDMRVQVDFIVEEVLDCSELIPISEIDLNKKKKARKWRK